MTSIETLHKMGYSPEKIAAKTGSTAYDISLILGICDESKENVSYKVALPPEKWPEVRLLLVMLVAGRSLLKKDDCCISLSRLREAYTSMVGRCSLS